jgi:hypothetical protein
MHLTAPSLFRPAPWWRLPRWADLANYYGNLKQGTGGHLSYRASGGLAGHLVHCPGCSDCAGTDPTSWTVVIASVTACSCVLRSGVNYISQLRDINGTYTLTQAADDPCAWRYLDTSGTQFARVWTNSSCNVAAATNTGMAMQLYRTQGVGRKWDFSVGPNTNELNAYGGSLPFSGTTLPAVVNICNEELAFTNANVNCTGGGRTATGGTATITAD